MTSITDVIVRVVSGPFRVRVTAGASVSIDPSSADIVLAAGLGIGVGMGIGDLSGTATGGTSNLSRTGFINIRATAIRTTISIMSIIKNTRTSTFRTSNNTGPSASRTRGGIAIMIVIRQNDPEDQSGDKDDRNRDGEDSMGGHVSASSSNRCRFCRYSTFRGFRNPPRWWFRHCQGRGAW